MGLSLRFYLLLLLLTCVAFGRGAAGETPHGHFITVAIYGNIYVLDQGKNTLRVYDNELKLVRETGGQGWEGERFDRASGLWAGNGIDVYVADYGNHRIVRFDRSLNFVSSFSTRDNEDPQERFGYPTDVAVSRLGELYICDTENSRILKVDRQNNVAGSFGGFGAGKGRLMAPSQIDVSPQDVVYVLDGTRIVLFDVFGNFTGILADGVLHDPRALWADQDGVLVVDGEMLYCFDEHLRPICSVSIGTLLGVVKNVRSIAAHRGKLLFLTEEGLSMAQDPRSTRLDKE